jgi:hypothetical protein
MKLLILAIYTENEFFYNMMLQTNKYLHALASFPKYNDHFAYYFIIYKPLDGMDYVIDSDRHILFINGTDSLMPGIIYKTLDAIDILMNRLDMKFDYIMRTTTATCIDIPKLIDTMNHINQEETIYMGYMLTLNWLDVPYGIVDETYWGTKYCGGNFAIFNSKIGLDMVTNRQFFVPYEQIVDDLVLGIYFQMNVSDTQYMDFPFNRTGVWDPNCLVSFHNSNKHRRMIDVNNHKNVIDCLIHDLSK